MYNRLTLLTITALGLATSASASGLNGQPYAISGSVKSATATCPYSAGVKLTGYSLISKGQQATISGGSKTIIREPVLVLSKGGNAPKTIFKLGKLFYNTGTNAGALTSVTLPLTDLSKGTYTDSLKIIDDTSFSMSIVLNFKGPKSLCKTTFDLTFTKGLPTSLYNLL